MFKELIARIFPFTISIFLIFVGLRFYEFILAPDDFFGEPVSAIYFFEGIWIDLLTSLLCTSILFVIQLPISYLTKSKMIYAFHFGGVIFLLIHFVLIQFFLIANEPLNESVFFLSFQELKLISGTGDRFSFGILIMVFSIVFFYFFIGNRFGKIKVSNRLHFFFGIGLMLSIFLIPVATVNSEDNHVETLFVNNRLASFMEVSCNYLIQKDSKSHLTTINGNNFNELDSSFYGGKKLSNEFPLIHELADKSEFAQLFKRSKKGPPNIVYIIVESLSTSLVGEKSHQTGHLMPFLDSLTKKSLYFPNFLSTCDRTHNVLPATLASLPNAPNGNMFMQMEYPLHWSLISLLKEQYFSRFYCGVDLHYSNMNGFMNQQETAYLVKDWESNSTNTTNSWGHPDNEVFEKSWKDYRHQSLDNRPRFDVFLTISTHDPFIIPNQKYYTQCVLDKIGKYRNPSQKLLDVKENAEKFGTYTYLDDVLRNYFNKAQKQSNFENTLFFIFGDHGNHLCIYDELERFKIPLIIYSPLLKKAQTIRSVSTHLDLPPTILNFLRTEYQLPLPQKVPFIGQELSLVKQYECKRSLPFNTVNLQNSHVLKGDYYLYFDFLFKVKKGLEIEKIKNQKIYTDLKKQLKQYNYLSEYLCFKDKIIPKSYFNSFTQSEVFKTIYRFEKEILTAAEKSSEFIEIGKDQQMKSMPKYFKVNFSCEYYIEEIEDLKSLPKLTVTLFDTKNERMNVNLWKQSNPKLLHDFKANHWNKVEYTLVIRAKDYDKEFVANTLRFFLLNDLKIERRIKKIKTYVSTNPT